MSSTPPLRRTLFLLCLLGAAAATAAKEEVIDLKSDDQVLVGPMNVAGLNRLGLAALGGTPGALGTFLTLFDRRLDTVYTAKEAGPAIINVHFRRPQTLHSVRLVLGDEGR